MITIFDMFRVPPRNVSLLCALKGPVRSLANLKYSYIRRKQFRENVLLPKEYLVSEVIHLEQCKPFVTIQWPIIACIPLIKHVKKDDEAKLVVKMAEINQIRSWRNEKPLAINRQYEKRNVNVSIQTFSAFTLVIYPDAKQHAISCDSMHETTK